MAAKSSRKARVLVMGSGFREQVERAGGTVEQVFQTDRGTAKRIAAGKVDALILTGGVDIDPLIYGEQPHPQTQSPNRQRDVAEMLALKAAIARGIPVLGVCRGSQLITAALGGSLKQHIGRAHVGFDHEVRPLRGTRLEAAMGPGRHMTVHIHHQAVKRVPKTLRIAARALDGTIEAVESRPGLPWIVGTQFHPEIGTQAHEQRVFDALVDEAARVANLRKPSRRAKPKPKTADKPSPFFHQSDLFTSGGNRRGGPVRVSWECFRCGIRFDDQEDYEDHMDWLHGKEEAER